MRTPRTRSSSWHSSGRWCTDEAHPPDTMSKFLAQLDALHPRRREQIASMLERAFPPGAESRANFQAWVDHVVDFIDEADPTPTGKYTIWIAKMFAKDSVRLPEDINKLREDLILFDQVKAALPPDQRDISSYPSHAALYRTIKSVVGARDQGRVNLEALPGVRELDFHWIPEPWRIFEITDPDSAVRIAKPTNWCVRNIEEAQAYILGGLPDVPEGGPLYLFIYDGQYAFLLHFPTFQAKDPDDEPFFEQPESINWGPADEMVWAIAQETGLVDKWVAQGEWGLLYELAILTGLMTEEQEEEFLRSAPTEILVAYAKKFLKRPYTDPAVLRRILSDVEDATSYAIEVLGRRWPELEEIFKNQGHIYFNERDRYVWHMMQKETA